MPGLIFECQNIVDLKLLCSKRFVRNLKLKFPEILMDYMTMRNIPIEQILNILKQNVKKIQILHLIYDEFQTIFPILHFLKNSSITELYLRGPFLCLKDGHILYEFLKNNNSLQKLRIGAGSMIDINLTTLPKFIFALKENSTLKILELPDCNFNDHCVQKMGSILIQNRTLEVLDLQFNFISDLGAHTLENILRINSTIKEIRLYGNILSHEYKAVLQNHPIIKV